MKVVSLVGPLLQRGYKGDKRRGAWRLWRLRLQEREQDLSTRIQPYSCPHHVMSQNTVLQPFSHLIQRDLLSFIQSRNVHSEFVAMIRRRHHGQDKTLKVFVATRCCTL